MEFTLDKTKISLLRTGIMHVQAELTRMLDALNNEKLNSYPDPLVVEYLTNQIEITTDIYTWLFYLGDANKIVQIKST